jgi:hypothetical protein
MVRTAAPGGRPFVMLSKLLDPTFLPVAAPLEWDSGSSLEQRELPGVADARVVAGRLSSQAQPSGWRRTGWVSHCTYLTAR